MIHWNCPHCREPLEAPESAGNNRQECPKCRKWSNRDDMLTAAMIASPGRPIPTASIPPDHVQQVEMTSKVYKRQILNGTILACVGMLIILAAAMVRNLSNDRSLLIVLLAGGSLLCIIGLAIWGRARFQAWWHHG